MEYILEQYMTVYFQINYYFQGPKFKILVSLERGGSALLIGHSKNMHSEKNHRP